MNMNLRTERISLQVLGLGYEECDQALWQTFRKTAVEPGQASSPGPISFADECLLCAQIVVNPQAERPNEDSILDDSTDALASVGHMLTGASTPPYLPGSPKAGIIYLYAGPANLPAGEANVGVIIRKDMQGRGYAREAVQLVLRWAFEELKFHRVQAAILDAPFKDRALRLFIGSGFAHEGTKRRAVYQPEGEGMAGIWKDVTYLAMLDTEWMLRSTLARRSDASQRPMVSVWDEMFARHSREREELVRWEEKHGRVRRSSSMETLRENVRGMSQDLAYLTDDDALSSIGEPGPSLSGSVPPSPRLDITLAWEEDSMHALSANEVADQGWERIVETSFAARRRASRQSIMEGSFLELSPTFVLPSIPSPTRLSEGNLQSPITIPSPTSIPPFSPSPSPVAPSPANSHWSDSEEEDNWPEGENPIQPSVRPRTEARSARSRSNSAWSESSSDSWSDAPSSLWDMISDVSDESHPDGPGHF